MREGTVELFNGKSLKLAIGLWAEGRGQWIDIHITSHGPHAFHTTVTNDPDSVRFHETLFRDLRKVLVDNHRWPEELEVA